MKRTKEKFIHDLFEMLDNAPMDYVRDIEVRLKGFEPKDFAPLKKAHKFINTTVLNNSFSTISFSDNIKIIQHFE